MPNQTTTATPNQEDAMTDLTKAHAKMPTDDPAKAGQIAAAQDAHADAGCNRCTRLVDERRAAASRLRIRMDRRPIRKQSRAAKQAAGQLAKARAGYILKALAETTRQIKRINQISEVDLTWAEAGSLGYHAAQAEQLLAGLMSWAPCPNPNSAKGRHARGSVEPDECGYCGAMMPEHS